MCARFTPIVRSTHNCRYVPAVLITDFYFGYEAKYRSMEVEIITTVLRKCLVGLPGLGYHSLYSDSIRNGGGEIFRTRPDRPWGPPSLLYNGYRVFSGGKAAGAWS